MYKFIIGVVVGIVAGVLGVMVAGGLGRVDGNHSADTRASSAVARTSAAPVPATSPEAPRLAFPSQPAEQVAELRAADVTTETSASVAAPPVPELAPEQLQAQKELQNEEAERRYIEVTADRATDNLLDSLKLTEEQRKTTEPVAKKLKAAYLANFMSYPDGKKEMKELQKKRADLQSQGLTPEQTVALTKADVAKYYEHQSTRYDALLNALDELRPYLDAPQAKTLDNWRDDFADDKKELQRRAAP